MNNQS